MTCQNFKRLTNTFPKMWDIIFFNIYWLIKISLYMNFSSREILSFNLLFLHLATNELLVYNMTSEFDQLYIATNNDRFMIISYLYTKQFYRLACENGRYGSGCKISCGHCFGSDVCHHINGSCPGNCSDGFTGETCTEGKSFQSWVWICITGLKSGEMFKFN